MLHQILDLSVGDFVSVLRRLVYLDVKLVSASQMVSFLSQTSLCAEMATRDWCSC